MAEQDQVADRELDEIERPADSDPIVVLATSDNWFYVGSAVDVIQHFIVENERTIPGGNALLRYHDATGRPLRVSGRTLVVGGPAQPDGVLRGIARAIAFARKWQAGHPEHELSELPIPDVQGSLTATIELFYREFQGDTPHPTHSGTRLHNLWHAIGG